jgi:hypothetical protein
MMLDKPASETVVASYEIDGRTFEVVRTTWRLSPKPSFDVHDKETRLCLTLDGLADKPTAEQVEHLLAKMRHDHRGGTLDPLYMGAKNLVDKVFKDPTE